MAEAPAPPLSSAPWPAPYAKTGRNPLALNLPLMGLPIAVALIDNAGIVISGNDALKATVGLAYYPGTRPEWLFVAEDADKIARAVADTLSTSERTEVRAALHDRPDEKQIVSIVPVPPGFGISALLAMRDIREQLRLEAQVAAVTRMQAVGQLAGGIAHDFNNILAAVLGMTEQLLERHPAGDDEHDSLSEIRRNGLRAAGLVAQLLAFARRQPQRQQVLDLAPLVGALRPLLEQLLGKGIELEIDSDDLKSAVLADPGQVEQVIVNLAINARDAMANQGRLRIAVCDVPAAEIAAKGHRIIPRVDHVAIDVTDTGGGIPPEIAGKIFEPFFTTKPMGQGTGLGLSTVYGIVKQTGGYIFATPAPGGVGTKFSVFLPAVPAGDRPQEAAGLSEPLALHADSLAGVRLLLVEDDAAVRAILERGMKRFGPIITAAADAMIALAILDTGAEFDVLVSDIMMPGIDGVELASRCLQMRPDIGVVLMSGFAEAPLHRAVSAQDVHFLSKPFALADLARAIVEANRERRRGD
jgi:signal transduction histidine kinase/ActR/RegA family two-component response regulator